MTTLWRVQVGAVSHRYVEAETRDEAVELVASSLMRSLDLQAAQANSAISRAFDSAGPVQRKRLLASLDALTAPTARRDSKMLRRRLARLIRQDQDERAWMGDQLRRLPPLADPDRIETILRSAEIGHIEQNFLRLREWDRRSPLHD